MQTSRTPFLDRGKNAQLAQSKSGIHEENGNQPHEGHLPGEEDSGVMPT
jgi:hypothetical protein